MSFGPQINGYFGLRRLYRRTTPRASDLNGDLNVRNYNDFTVLNVACNAYAGPVQQRPHRLQPTGSQHHVG
jgi:hypothetical protein